MISLHQITFKLQALYKLKGISTTEKICHRDREREKQKEGGKRTQSWSLNQVKSYRPIFLAFNAFQHFFQKTDTYPAFADILAATYLSQAGCNTLKGIHCAPLQESENSPQDWEDKKPWVLISLLTNREDYFITTCDEFHYEHLNLLARSIF